MKKFDIESPELRENNPYRVPDGYFSDLRMKLQERVAEQETAREAGGAGWWRRVAGIGGAAASFVCLVILAVTGFYFTGYQAQIREAEENDALIGYTLYAEDLETLLEMYEQEESLQYQAAEGDLFAESVDEYLDTYGYGYFEEEPSEMDFDR